MAKPQQSELRRSGRVPALDPDASEAKLSAQRRIEGSDPDGPIPEDQRPGHHPDHDQDKPDLDAFAARLGVVGDDEEPDDAPNVTDAPTPSAKTSWTRSWSPIGLALIGPVTGFFVIRGVVRAVRKMRR